MNPEEATAVGASLIASQVKLNYDEIQIMDKLPLSIGIESLAGEFIRIFERDTILPSKVTKIVTTVVDNQPKIDLKLYLGEREIASENKSLGDFTISLPLMKRGEPKVNITFSLNNKGDLFVSTEEELSKKTASYSTKVNSGLTQEFIEKFLDFKEKFKDYDEQKIKMIRLKTDADRFLYDFETHIKEVKAELQDQESERLEEIEINIQNLHNLLKTDDYDKILKSFEKLQHDSEEIFHSNSE